MVNYQVNAQEMSSISISVKSLCNSVNSEVNKMHLQLKSLQNTWKGAAANSFNNIVDKWSSAQKNIEEAILDINKALDVASQNYKDAEQSAIKMFSGK